MFIQRRRPYFANTPHNPPTHRDARRCQSARC
jgi:hypothetical protein